MLLVVFTCENKQQRSFIPFLLTQTHSCYDPKNARGLIVPEGRDFQHAEGWVKGFHQAPFGHVAGS